jgi:transposase
MAYSLDLRQRVVNAVNEGSSKKAAALRYNVSRGTVQNWTARVVLAADKAGPKEPWRLKPERLQAEIEATPDAYLDELAETLGVSVSTVGYGLKRLHVTRKKKHALQPAK